jgi:tetratricopeptide (TPR) repeat protein
MQQGQYAEAKAYFARATEMRGVSKQVWFNLGEACQRSGDLDGAIRAFGEALARDPGWLEAEERLRELQKKGSLRIE